MSEFASILIEGYYVENLSTDEDHWFMPSQFDEACVKLAEWQAAGHQCRLIAEVDA